jgi:hypothetical protein
LFSLTDQLQVRFSECRLSADAFHIGAINPKQLLCHACETNAAQ